MRSPHYLPDGNLGTPIEKFFAEDRKLANVLKEFCRCDARVLFINYFTLSE
jgi:hypothetical protein